MGCDVSSVIKMHAKCYLKNCDEHSNQLGILQEECAELIQAISKFERKKQEKDELTSHIIEEMTHVLISIEVCKEILSIDDADIIDEVFAKHALLIKEKCSQKE